MDFLLEESMTRKKIWCCLICRKKGHEQHVLVLVLLVLEDVLLWNLIQNNIITGGYTRNIDIRERA